MMPSLISHSNGKCCYLSLTYLIRYALVHARGMAYAISMLNGLMDIWTGVPLVTFSSFFIRIAPDWKCHACKREMKSGAYGASLAIHRYLKCDKKVKMLQQTFTFIQLYVHLLVTLLQLEKYIIPNPNPKECFNIILLMQCTFTIDLFVWPI